MKGLQRIILWAAMALVLAFPVRAECVHDYVLYRQEPGCETGGFEWFQCTLCGNRTGKDCILSYYGYGYPAGSAIHWNAAGQNVWCR